MQDTTSLIANRSHTDAPILVLGATGKTGRRVLQRLNALGLPTRAGSRTAPQPFDWGAPEQWDRVIDGVGAIYITYQPDLATPQAPEAIERLCELAFKMGVRKLVLLSGRGEPEAAQCEDIVKGSGCEWTILRSAWFAQNFSEGFFVSGVNSGVLALPVGDVPEPFVDAEDVADVATTALTRPGHHQAIYELTGPRSLTFADAVAEIARACQRQIVLQPVPIDAFASAMRQMGQDEGSVALIRYLFTTVLDGRNALPGDGVRQALSRAPQAFEHYCRRTAATQVWTPEAPGTVAPY